MPGLNQLKKFSEDMQALGDEEKLRAQRGEKVIPLSLPNGIPEDDDSNDFILGLPEKTADENGGEAETDDITSLINDDAPIDINNLDSLLGDTSNADDDALADFLNDDTLSAPTEDLPDAETDSLAADSADSLSIEDETPLEDMDLDSLLQPSGADSESSSESSVDEFSSADTEEINLNEDIPASVLENDGTQPAPEPSEAPAEEFSDLNDALSGLGDLNDMPNIDDFGSMDASESSPESTDTAFDASSIDVDSLLGDDAPVSEVSESEISEPVSAEAENEASGEDVASALADMDNLEPTSETSSDSGLDLGSFDIDSLISGDDSSPAEDAPAPSSDSGNDALSALDGMDIDSLGTAEVPDATMEVPDTSSEDASATEEVPFESFDTSAMDGVDFSAPTPAANGDDFPATDDTLNAIDDFELDSSFEIPGFSDTETADMGKKRPGLDTVDFSKGKEGIPKNSLTDGEYIQFKKNLANYPLNLRIAIEDFIARDEFTDDAVFEIIEKVLKKTSARQLATQLEKILDISISIPRDFEHRSFAEYEAYKQSFQYQLKNRIIPAAIVGVILAFVCFGLFKAGEHFIYKPVMANIHYKQGYTLLESNEFPQAEDEFNEAVRYKAVKKWFFKYAQGYREKKQYERAANMYKNILRTFNHDKQAGLDYADMELHDRANYERAEEVVRREILDYHINDADGILMLGDVFLEWAEIAPEKYELAKQQYLDLIQRYGSNNVYLSRMLRYNIRTDKLREVLTYKNMFYVSKQDKQNLKNLGAADWTELSGYLLEKLYGTLSKNDEYLRSSIEDVLAMLNLAIKADPSNPVARYNLARYYIQNGNMEQAKSELEVSLDLFGNTKVRTKKNIYREINATRVLGELYADAREYLKAQTVYTRGINLYNEEHENSDFEGDENTGKLFADMGDLDYFISGDMEDALFNYEQSIAIKNDTPSINYRVGSIYYGRKQYDEALVSFINVAEKAPKNPNVLLSLGNVLSLRGDNFAAESYYSDLLQILDATREKFLLPQSNSDDFETVDLYLKVNNNLGVTLYRLAQQTGNSNMNAQAIVRLSDSMRAWDSLTRNPDTLIRLEGSNLAAQNSKYITHPYPDFEPAIYTDIPRLLSGEKPLE